MMPHPVFFFFILCRPGYILDESPAHCRTLTDGSGCLHKVPTAHQEQLSVSCSRILHTALSHALVSRDLYQQSSDHQLYRQPALPTELQPRTKKKTVKLLTCHLQRILFGFHLPSEAAHFLARQF